MAYEAIKTDVKDGVLTLTLNRPDRLNAFNNIMRDEMIDVFTKVNTDDEVRAVIVTGEGRGFCAGADLGAGGDTFNVEKRDDPNSNATHWRDGGGLVTLAIFECLKPVISACNGPAVGVGATMQLPMDIRLGSTAARYGFVFSRRGLVMEACSSWFLPRLVGIEQAAKWVYSGRVFEAQEAHEGGLVSELLAPEDLLPRANEIAREIAENASAVSVALMRQMMWRMLGADHPMEAHKIDSRGISTLGKMADAKEGVESFLEKRPPDFKLKPSEDLPAWFPWWDEPRFR
ncbi:MAG: crotonase/enoyl-CoA hydratase family protein [Alphaproteobacteria bacterium]|nr:crotonase/enoyl-CoA hydratase family protein [Alphaproteobacteria bacterium]